MKVTIKELVDSAVPLRELTTKPMPAKTAYWVARYFKVAAKEYENFQEIKNKKIAEFGTKNMDDQFEVTGDSLKKVQDELIPLLNEEIEIAFDKLSIGYFGEAIVSPDLLAPLEWMISE